LPSGERTLDARARHGLVFSLAVFLATLTMDCGGMQAVLPMQSMVPPTDAMPIDGVYTDSCYSATLTHSIKLDVRPPDYLSRIVGQRARIVLSSGGLEPVADGGGGGGGEHSAFARHFRNELRANKGVLDSTTLYSKTRRPVMLAADQTPEPADIRKAREKGGDFLFIPAGR